MMPPQAASSRFAARWPTVT